MVSGLARGIDTFAHKGALATGTVAVIANGIDQFYPPENERLTREMWEKGAVITEQPFGAAPFAAAFPGRNRIIAGMTLGTLVVEAAPKSGSLITARFAAEQGRDVFAVPGHPLDPRAQGCNKLLKAGAMLVEDATDIIHALALPARATCARCRCWAMTPPMPPKPKARKWRTRRKRCWPGSARRRCRWTSCALSAGLRPACCSRC